MRKLIGLALFAVLFAAMAQAADKAEVYGGFQYTHLEPSFNAAGWNAALTGNFNSHFGITADFSGSYDNGGHFYTYTFGPVVKADLKVAKPFVHALFGGATAGGGGGSTSGFNMMLGGGVDVGHGVLAWRLIQVDWMYNRFSGISSSKNVRVGTGLVFRF